jgi:uncharacterized protein
MTEEHAESPLQRLLELQQLDARADQLRYQIEHHPARVALSELHIRHQKLAQATAPLAARAIAYDARQSEFEREIEEAGARVKAIEQRLRSGAAGSYRDEGAMSSEIESLRRRTSQLEDEELELMEEREPVDAELAGLREEDARVEQEARSRHGELTAAEAALTAEIAAGQPARDALAATIDPPLLADYERLRARLSGVGVAHLVHGTCSGCNLALSAGEVDRIAHAPEGTVFHCEQCGRVLVP